jgi:hypothetical protein
MPTPRALFLFGKPPGAHAAETTFILPVSIIRKDKKIIRSPDYHSLDSETVRKGAFFGRAGRLAAPFGEYTPEWFSRSPARANFRIAGAGAPYLAQFHRARCGNHIPHRKTQDHRVPHPFPRFLRKWVGSDVTVFLPDQ